MPSQPMTCILVHDQFLKTFNIFQIRELKCLIQTTGRTKYMFSTSRDVRHIDSRITAVNYTFDTVKEFIYLGCTKNDVSLEIKRRMISAFDSIVSCMSTSMAQVLSIVLIFSCCAGSAMSFVLRRMLRRDGYLMRGSAEVGEEDNLASVGKIKTRKPCHRLV